MGNPTNAEVKLTIAKLIEVAYSTNKGMTTKIVMQKGAFRLRLDEEGNAELTSTVGSVQFIGGPTLEKIGVSVRRMSVNFSGNENGDVHYTASVGVKITTFTVSGDFNIVDLITSCSGLLCQAARLLKGRNPAIEAEMQRIMGY
jgi:hypothetical protein